MLTNSISLILTTCRVILRSALTVLTSSHHLHHYPLYQHLMSFSDTLKLTLKMSRMPLHGGMSIMPHILSQMAIDYLTIPSKSSLIHVEHVLLTMMQSDLNWGQMPFQLQAPHHFPCMKQIGGAELTCPHLSWYMESVRFDKGCQPQRSIWDAGCWRRNRIRWGLGQDSKVVDDKLNVLCTFWPAA